MPQDPATFLWLFSAGMMGGIVNAIAGGATLFTFPALLGAGVPALIANASNSVALLPGYLTALVALRPCRPWRVRPEVVALALLGTGAGAAGAVLLLSTGEARFTGLIPWLLGAATLLFAAAPALRRCAFRAGRHQTWAVGLLAVGGVYGGYFGAGLGVILMAALHLRGPDRQDADELHRLLALKNLLAACINASAVVMFIIRGVVDWPATLLMLLGALSGGYLGGYLARHVPERCVRAGILGAGTGLTLYYALQGVV